MNRDLSETLHLHVSAGANGAFTLGGGRARRVQRSVTRRRLLRGAAATTGTLAALGGVAAGAAYAADHGFFGIASGNDPSPAPSGESRPSVSAIPSPTVDSASIVWPEQQTPWVVRELGSQVVPVECGVQIADLPTGLVTISEARRATRDEVAAAIAEDAVAYGEPEPGQVIRKDSDVFVPSDDMYLATWTPNSVVGSAHGGATFSVSGLEEGFASWDALEAKWGADYGNLGLQLWGGYAVVEDGVVLGRGHRADPTVGAGTIQIGLHESSDPGLQESHMILITKPWQGVEWCPSIVPGEEGRDLVAIAAATSFDIAPNYGWAYLPAD